MMNWKPRTPLAWLNLTHNVRRLALAAAGIGFAVLLIFMQLGFQGALFDSTVQVPKALAADLVIVSKAKFTITVKNVFSRRRLITARACPGVEAVQALYYDNRFAWKNPHDGRSYQIRALAFNPLERVLLTPGVWQQQAKLIEPGTVLFDELSKSDYGSPEPGTVSEYAGKRAEVVGMFRLGTDFANDGNIIMSDVNYVRFVYPAIQEAAQLDAIDIGLVQLARGAVAADVVARLAAMLPGDVKVMTKDDFIRAEQQFWRTSTPIGYVFKFGVVLGFIVGVIICYQILYADVSDHLAEYATLKAMGYRGRYFFSVVLQEALLLALLGFFPGLVVSELLYGGLSKLTGLLLELTFARAAGVLLVAILMCTVSGLLTIRKLQAADPAELFA